MEGQAFVFNALSNFSGQVKFDGSPETHRWPDNTLQSLASWPFWSRSCAGLLAGGAGEATLWTAWLSLLAFTAIGAAIGWLAERIVRDSVSSRILSNPRPESPNRRPPSAA